MLIYSKATSRRSLVKLLKKVDYLVKTQIDVIQNYNKIKYKRHVYSFGFTAKCSFVIHKWKKNPYSFSFGFVNNCPSDTCLPDTRVQVEVLQPEGLE